MATMPPGNLIGGNLVTPDQPSILTVTEIAANLIPSVTVEKVENFYLAVDSSWSGAIQRAEDSLSSRGGGKLLFAGPLYTISSTITKRSKTYWEGAGRNASILRLADGANVDMVVGENFASLTGTNSLAGIYNFGFSGMTLDGNKANNPTGGDGIKVYGYSFDFRDLSVRNCKGRGLVTEWSNSPAAPSVSTDADWWESSWFNVRVHENGGIGVDWRGPHDSSWVSVWSYFNSGTSNFYIGPSTGGGGPLYAVNCHAYGSPAQYQWYCEQRVVLSNCVGEGGSVGQIYVGTGNTVIHGGEWFSVPAQTPSAKGIVLADGISGLDIITSVLNCNGGAIDFGAGPTASRIKITSSQTSGTPRLGTVPTDGEITFTCIGVSGFDIFRTLGNFSSNGNVGVGTFNYGNGQTVVAVADTATPPNAAPANGWLAWAEGGVMKFRNANYARAIMPAQAEKSVTGLTGTLTVDVTDSDFARLTCSGATTITNFTGASPGRLLTLLFADNLATVQNNANIGLQGAVNFVSTSADTLTLRWSAASSKWFEVCRSVN